MRRRGSPPPDECAATTRAGQPGLRRGLVRACTAVRAERDRVDIEIGLEHRLSPELETILYRIPQESLNNIAKHARAGQVSISVDQLEEGTVRLRVRDDGVGFDTSNGAQLLREGHFGLAGMRERASLVGGTVEVGSIPGHGTTVEVRLSRRLPTLEAAAP